MGISILRKCGDSDHSCESCPDLFTEDHLRKDIYLQWGEHSLHMRLFDKFQDRSRFMEDLLKAYKKRLANSKKHDMAMNDYQATHYQSREAMMEEIIETLEAKINGCS